MFPRTTLDKAAKALDAARDAGVRIVTAETCTGGLIGACLTAVPGASQIYDRGFVLYHASAKSTALGVCEDIAAAHGAVSAEVTKGLAEGALTHSGAGTSVSLTGYAGPGGGNERDPVGTVYIAVARESMDTVVQRHVFPGDRDAVRLAGVDAALDLLAGSL